MQQQHLQQQHQQQQLEQQQRNELQQQTEQKQRQGQADLNGLTEADSLEGEGESFSIFLL